jgi:hypothetical protein
MIRADKFITDFVLVKDTALNKDTASIKLYQQIFLIHHISKEEFQRSFSFYQAHTGLFKELLDSLDVKSNTTPVNEINKFRPLTDTVRYLKDSVKNRKKIRRLVPFW